MQLERRPSSRIVKPRCRRASQSHPRCDASNPTHGSPQFSQLSSEKLLDEAHLLSSFFFFLESRVSDAQGSPPESDTSHTAHGSRPQSRRSGIRDRMAVLDVGDGWSGEIGMLSQNGQSRPSGSPVAEQERSLLAHSDAETCIRRQEGLIAGDFADTAPVTRVAQRAGAISRTFCFSLGPLTEFKAPLLLGS